MWLYTDIYTLEKEKIIQQFWPIAHKHTHTHTHTDRHTCSVLFPSRLKKLKKTRDGVWIQFIYGRPRWGGVGLTSSKVKILKEKKKINK